MSNVHCELILINRFTIKLKTSGNLITLKLLIIAEYVLKRYMWKKTYMTYIGYIKRIVSEYDSHIIINIKYDGLARFRTNVI